MVKRALTLLTSILIALPLLMPFNIYADESVNTAPFLGVNVQFTEVETEYTSMTMPILNFGYAGTQNTTGSITGKLACSALSAGECKTWSLQNSNGNSVAGLSFTMNLANLKLTENGVWQFNKAYNYIVDYEFVLDADYKGYVVLNGETTIYVNGSSFHHSIRQNGISEMTFTITDYELTKVTSPIMWNIPIESLSSNYYLFDNYKIVGFTDYDYYSYPFFEIKKNDSVFDLYVVNGVSFIFIFGVNTNIANKQTLENNFSFDGLSYVGSEMLYGSYDVNNNDYFRIFKVQFMGTKNGNTSIKYIGDKNIKYFGIYEHRTDINMYVSEDFGSKYNLYNQHETSTSVNSKNNQMQTTNNQLFTQEDAFKSNMQSAMQNVNNTFRLHDMGTKFVTSAQWVRTQYEQLTNNTPFASLITFSLITGLALILLGKVYR